MLNKGTDAKSYPAISIFVDVKGPDSHAMYHPGFQVKAGACIYEVMPSKELSFSLSLLTFLFSNVLCVPAIPISASAYHLQKKKSHPRQRVIPYHHYHLC